MTSPRNLRALAQRYRRMLFGFTDQRAVEALNELAAEYEAQADRLEAATRARDVCNTECRRPVAR